MLEPMRPATKGLGISILRVIVVGATAPKNLHYAGKLSRE